MRTERVTLEVTMPESPLVAHASKLDWEDIVARAKDEFMVPPQSVRVVPTPTAGIALTEDERDALYNARSRFMVDGGVMDDGTSWHRLHRQRADAIDAILARDAAAKAGAQTAAEDRAVYRETRECDLDETGGGVHEQSEDVGLDHHRHASRCNDDDGGNPPSTGSAGAVGRGGEVTAPAEPVAWGVIQEGEIVTARNTETDAKRAADGWYEGKIVPLYASPPDLAAEVERLKAENHRLARDAEEYRQQVETARGKLSEEKARFDAYENWVMTGRNEQHDRLVAERDALAARVAAIEADMAVAAGECGVSLPEHGSDAAKLLHANVMMRKYRIPELQARVAELEKGNWLTAEEREAVENTLGLFDEDGYHEREETLVALLARSSPPSVNPPTFCESWSFANTVKVRDDQWLASLAAAGVAVKETSEGGQ